MLAKEGQKLILDKSSNPWARISDIAKRVGVEPGNDKPSIIAQGRDGQTYDVMEVVEAVLDKLDQPDIGPILEAIALCAGNAKPILGEGVRYVTIREEWFDHLLAAFNDYRVKRQR